ncbi:MAG: hypothetical protein ACFFAO_04350 [Candidatus Hermodarchaeota archaeon]
MEIKNDFYEMRIDNYKNRVYFKIKGFWRDPNDLSNYLNDWENVLKRMRQGFTILTDATEMTAPTRDVVEQCHVPAQQLVMKKAGRIAEFVSSAITNLSVQNLGRMSGMDVLKKSFHTKEEAEAWLDEYMLHIYK